MNDGRQDKLPSRADDLLDALRCARRDYQNGTHTFEGWVYERRLIMREAEVLGLADELLSRANEA